MKWRERNYITVREDALMSCDLLHVPTFVSNSSSTHTHFKEREKNPRDRLSALNVIVLQHTPLYQLHLGIIIRSNFYFWIVFLSLLYEHNYDYEENEKTKKHFKNVFGSRHKYYNFYYNSITTKTNIATNNNKPMAANNDKRNRRLDWVGKGIH